MDAPINDWTPKKELLLEKWKFESSLYIGLHNYNAEYYKFIDKMCGIPALIINAVTTTTLFSVLNLENNQTIIISIASLLIVGTILQSLRDFLSIGKQIHNNINTSKHYQIVINDITEQLNQEPQDRINGKDFVKKINQSRNNIVLDAPYINHKSWKNLIKKLQNGDFILLENNTYFKNYFEKLMVQQTDSSTNNNPDNPNNPCTSVELIHNNRRNNMYNYRNNNGGVELCISNNISEQDYHKNKFRHLTIDSLKQKLAFHLEE